MVVSTKNRWGDLLEEEEELPPTTTSGPDAKGIITKVEYYRNDKGDVMKRTTKTRTIKIERKVAGKASERRQNWKKFGDAASERATDAITGQATEDIPFERLRNRKQQEEDKGKTEFVVSNAGADNKAAASNLRDLLRQKRMERQLLAAKGLLDVERPPDEDGGSGNLAPAGSKPGSWVPPSLRGKVAGGGEESGSKRRDENSVRVTNLSEDVTEADLFELFGPFGPIHRIFIAKDRETGESRGFAFVNFIHRQDAQTAIKTLDGYGYDNLILSVSFAAPRADRS